jgi:hypothetical protein
MYKPFYKYVNKQFFSAMRQSRKHSTDYSINKIHVQPYENVLLLLDRYQNVQQLTLLIVDHNIHIPCSLLVHVQYLSIYSLKYLRFNCPLQPLSYLFIEYIENKIYDITANGITSKIIIVGNWYSELLFHVNTPLLVIINYHAHMLTISMHLNITYLCICFSDYNFIFNVTTQCRMPSIYLKHSAPLSVYHHDYNNKIQQYNDQYFDLLKQIFKCCDVDQFFVDFTLVYNSSLLTWTFSD